MSEIFNSNTSQSNILGLHHLFDTAEAKLRPISGFVPKILKVSIETKLTWFAK